MKLKLDFVSSWDTPATHIFDTFDLEDLDNLAENVLDIEGNPGGPDAIIKAFNSGMITSYRIKRGLFRGDVLSAVIEVQEHQETKEIAP
jgi:hypothetical protein